MKYMYLGFSFFKVVVSGEYLGTKNLSFFENHLNEFNEFNCLVSMDRLFHCLSVDGKKKNYNFTSLFWFGCFGLVHF